MSEFVYISELHEVKSHVYKIEAQDILVSPSQYLSHYAMNIISSMTATCTHKARKEHNCYNHCVVPIETNIKLKLQKSGDYHAQVTMSYKIQKPQQDIDNENTPVMTCEDSTTNQKES